VDAERRGSLRDGSQLVVRRITPDDAPALTEGFASLSEESRRLRFLSAKPRLTSKELRYFTEVDGHDHEALVAVDPASGHGVGIARFVRDREVPTRADVAVTVADEWQQRGVATLLLECLADRARAEGITHYTALVSGENDRVHQLLEHMGIPVRIGNGAGGVGEYEIRIPSRGVGEQLVSALRGAAAGRLPPPASLLGLLRTLVPLRVAPVRPRGHRRPDPEAPGAEAEDR
jgi:GNAT superfamily N-acetyltransferase